MRAAVAAFLFGLALHAWALDPHMDPGLLPTGCPACHRGHGVSRSPMLPGAQRDLCLSCHGTRGGRDHAVMDGALAGGAEPQLLDTVLSQPFVHPIDDRSFSRFEPGAITCTSCHSPHRGVDAIRASGVAGEPRRSTLDPTRLEYELCGDCHGRTGVPARGLRDIGKQVNPNNRSFHPIEAPASDGSPSVRSSLSGRQISCTDCHGNSEAGGVAGPHGSSVPHILRDGYSTIDGQPESMAVYGLCYGCHDRDAVLSSLRFPEHRRHVVGERVACSTCHDPHGSVENRALIRFGEATGMAGPSPSNGAGRLAFESTGPGSGECYVSCHGIDHTPAVYGDTLAIRDLPTGPAGRPAIGRSGR